jgi:hypothetical protein
MIHVTTPDEVERLRAFITDVMLKSWEGYDVEGDTLQELGLKHGVLVQVPYDPAKHGESEFEVEPGEPWYVLAWSKEASK